MIPQRFKVVRKWFTSALLSNLSCAKFDAKFRIGFDMCQIWERFYHAIKVCHFFFLFLCWANFWHWHPIARIAQIYEVDILLFEKRHTLKFHKSRFFQISGMLKNFIYKHLKDTKNFYTTKYLIYLLKQKQIDLQDKYLFATVLYQICQKNKKKRVAERTS